MRLIILFVISFFLCLSAQAATFIFKSGKSVQGTVRYENSSTIQMLESSGLEMTLRKSELNLEATRAANIVPENVVPVVNIPNIPCESVVNFPKGKRPVKVYTNRDVRSEGASFSPPNPESSPSWKKSVAILEREFNQLSGACRAAGGGPSPGKVLRTHTYNVEGKPVRVTGYWADPGNIEHAKRICERAIRAQSALQQARRGLQDFLESQKNQTKSIPAQ